MNRFGKLVVCSVLATSPALMMADQKNTERGEYRDRGGQEYGPGMMMDEEQVERMHQNMSQMQGMMQQMPNAGSRAERQRLLDQHMEAMEEHMELMHRGMMGPGSYGYGMGGPGMMDNDRGMMGGPPGGKADDKQSRNPGKSRPQGRDEEWGEDQRLRMMENRLNAMQLMMEQMLQHQREWQQQQ
ncbi:hypothetical protein [Marinobacter caseinilyticus]|uniref:hypothetical protein n=1 Tax=Marinobacter caseinilyticus TaxID=2692195 RepID=UPI001F168127|nr:hypothetical protein [Marinobacter caseinilyticus]